MYKYVKRFFDLIMALILVIIFLIPMIIIAILIKLDSKGPMFFKQERTGKNGKIFLLYKFRSMAVDNDVHDFNCQDKKTRVGNVLRKLSLDEFPQLINIIKGEMSFIGPRPWIPDYYENMTDYQRRRNDVLPGITGLAQVKGRNNINIIAKINYDLEYVKNFSFKQDVKIFFLTIAIVLSKEGADAGKNTIHTELEMLMHQEVEDRKQVKKISKSKKKIGVNKA